MNSLAVVYAQMNRYSLAAALFEQVLAIDPADLMALFNLGFIYLRRQDGGAALACFERALAIDPDNFELLLQTGQLYCQSGKYCLAIEVLSRAEKNTVAPLRSARPGEGGRMRGNLGHGLVYRYLGEAYKGDGQYGPAMTCLQRATRYNSRDGAALSLLGEVYRLTGQGLEIAESLCRQAVELDGGQWEHWYRLGAVHGERRDYPAARAALNQSLRLRRHNGIVLELLAQVYEQEGQPRRAGAIRGRLRQGQDT
jgi:tetratricopeptide (TPR) repeat protein